MWSFLTITCSENNIWRFWLSWPTLPSESSITTVNTGIYTQSLHNENSVPVQRYTVKKLLHRNCDKGLWKPWTMQCCRSYFTSGENKSNCLDHISHRKWKWGGSYFSESEYNCVSHISPIESESERTLFTNRNWYWSGLFSPIVSEREADHSPPLAKVKVILRYCWITSTEIIFQQLLNV